MERIEKLALFLVTFIPFALAGSLLYFTVAGNQIHVSLGEYGVKIDAYEGHDTSGALGAWWPGYLVFENAVTQWLLVTFCLGLVIGTFSMYGVSRVVRSSEDKEGS